MTLPDPHEATLLLKAAAAGDSVAAEKLLPLVYGRLRALAGSYLQGRVEHILQPTALVHEAYLRLFQMQEPANDRSHFLAIAATAMRQILADHARRKKSTKRGGDRGKLEFDKALVNDLAADDGDRDGLVALHEALQALALADERRYKVVELRFLGGLSVEETARTLGISERTVESDWRAARAWLKMALAE
ncbi:MAG: sigma-70 family RNA polymerase sigma factor [Phycisphaerae bacterium]|nr:sigma-70 family RNA polymerase sigma factor [Phycisphaerae bacterium]